MVEYVPCVHFIIIMIMYIYHALVNALSVRIIHINLNTVFYTYVEDSPTKTIYKRHFMETHTGDNASSLRSHVR